MQGAGFLTKIRTILLPLLHNSSVSAVLAAFGGSVFNLAITTILYPPNYSTLPVYISDSYNDLKFGYAAGSNYCWRCIYHRDYADFGNDVKHWISWKRKTAEMVSVSNTRN